VRTQAALTSEILAGCPSRQRTWTTTGEEIWSPPLEMDIKTTWGLWKPSFVHNSRDATMTRIIRIDRASGTYAQVQ
jgi:hypothetical protein